jgi:hypothetical protein
MNIRTAVIFAVRAALRGKGCVGYMHRVFVMPTNPRWSSL